MKRLYAYTYCTLRYVHDVVSGEFVNVGVVLYAPEPRYLSALCRTTYGRLSKVFPGMQAEHFKSLMRYIQARLEEQGGRVSDELPFNTPSSVIEFAQAVLPKAVPSSQPTKTTRMKRRDPARHRRVKSIETKSAKKKIRN